MLSTKTIQLQLPIDLHTDRDEQFQRSLIQNLLMEKRITMANAMESLSHDDLQWLVTAILQTAQENLFIACHIDDETWSVKYWQRYSSLLGHLFIWYHREGDGGHTPNYHGQLLSILRTIVRRCAPQDLNSDQVELIQRFTLRLQDQELHREDIFSITQTLQEHGLDTLLDLSPIADKLFVSYVEELGRS